jgi:cytochrome c peroxidase
MKQIRTICCLLLVVAFGVAWVQILHRPKPINFTIPKGWPQPLYNFKENPVTVEGFNLGKELFYDGMLSKDGNFSCASCHQQFGAFATFDHNLSHGFNNSLTTRNAPALQNLAWKKEFMQDGGIHHLDVLFLTPLTAENEMAETLQNVLKKLRTNANYRKMFKAAFGDETINTQRIGRALSQYMVMLVSSNSKYDRVMNGKDAFNLPEQLGYNIFKQKCSSCHQPPFFTDESYRNIGMPLDSFLNDYGRMNITRLPTDSLKFRVPSLRNVAVTAPYGHDGRFFSLYNVFEHYRKNMQVQPNTDSALHKKLPLSNFEIGQLTAFLYTLTDSSFLNNKLYGIGNSFPTIIHNHR